MRHAVSADELSRRVIASNRALELISCPNYRPIWLKFKGFRAFVCWEYHGEKCYQWVTRGNDFYPTWDCGPWGGTTSTAMSQLIRWCQGKPVLPLGCFQYWCGEGIRLAGERGDELVAHLKASGYPAEVTCVVCGEKPHGLDWWSRDGVSGPCCKHDGGCRYGKTIREASR